MPVSTQRRNVSRFRNVAAAALLAAACAAATGCASGKAREPDPFASAEWSRVPGTSPALPVAALPAPVADGGRWVAAWIDADFSAPNVTFGVTPVSFSASPDGVVRFRPAGPSARAESWAQVRAALSVRGGGEPLGVLFTAGGSPVLRVGAEPPPEMRDFLRVFVAGLDDAGVDFVLLVPSAFVWDDGAMPEGASLPAPEKPWEF